MQLQRQNSLKKPYGDICIIIGCYADQTFTSSGQQLDQESQGFLSRLVQRGDLKKEIAECLLIPELPAIEGKVLLVSCGEKSALNENAFRKILQKVAAQLPLINTKECYCELTELKVLNRDESWCLSQAATLCALPFYRFNYYKFTPSQPGPMTKLTFASSDNNHNDAALAHAKALAAGIALIKDLGHQPPNICTPTYLANQAQQLSQRQPTIKTTILEETDMEKLGMGALLAVSKGSREPAKFIQMEYHGAAQNQKPFVFIGKGITFDTGGISLKPPPAMDEMKFDMCGGATVIGLLQAVAELKLPLNIIGLVPSAENMPGGHATRPGDIVKSLSGQTIEILNTDAEGRLILADSLTYAERFNPELVIDIATLTGSILLTFGHIASGVMGNDEKLIQEILVSANTSGERAWQLPLWDEYQEMLKSPYADLPNIHGDNFAKAIIAGCFLSRFAKKFPWVHLDVAGTAFIDGPNKGATGKPLPMLLQFLLEKSSR